MADFGHLLQESLAAAGQAQIDQASALALIGNNAVDKALQLARGAVDLLRASGEQQLQAKLDDVESSVLMARKLGAVGVVGATAVGAVGTAAVGSYRYGKRQYDQAISDALQDAGDQFQRTFLPHRLAGQPCLPCLDQSSG